MDVNSLEGQIELTQVTQPFTGTGPAAVNPRALNAANETASDVRIQFYGNEPVVKMVLTFLNAPVAITNDSGVAGNGALLLGTFAEGLIHVLGATSNLTATTSGSGNISATYTGLASLGSVVTATGDTSLTSTKANVAPSYSISAAVAGVANIQMATTAGAWLNGEGAGNAVPLYLNLEVATAKITANDTLYLNGTVTIVFANCGDHP